MLQPFRKPTSRTQPPTSRTQPPTSRTQPPTSLHAQLLERLVRAAGPARVHHVAQILQVFHAHLAREEAGRGQVAEAVEECDALAHFRLRLLRPRDVVEDGGALCGGAV